MIREKKITPVQRILHQHCWWCWRHLEGLHMSRITWQAVSIFVNIIQTCQLMFFIVSLDALINHKQFQHDTSSPHAIIWHWIYNGNYNGKCAQKQNIVKKALSDGPSATLRPLFNSNMTKVSIIKYYQICTRTIRSGFVGIPKYVFCMLYLTYKVQKYVSHI